MPPQELIVDAILFDMDGTLIDSTSVADLTYKQFVERHKLPHTGHLHGVRMVDAFRTLFPKAQQNEITERAVKFEMDLLENAKVLKSEGKEGLVILPGVERLLEQIRSHPDAEQHYAICTSASHLFATTALSTAGIVPPTHLLTADDCAHGKPHPDPYLKGAAMLGKDPKRCLVIEDAPAGLRSGRAAGCKVLGVCTSHSREQVESVVRELDDDGEEGKGWVVEGLDEVSVEWTMEGRLRVVIGSG